MLCFAYVKIVDRDGMLGTILSEWLLFFLTVEDILVAILLFVFIADLQA